MSNKSVKNKTKINLNPQLKNQTKHLSIDEIDKKILKLLNWDARLSYRDIARQMKVSTGTVINRLDKLKQTGVINGYSVNINSKKLGYSITAIIELIAASKLSLMRKIDDIIELPNVYAIYHTTGNIDMVVIAKFRDIEEIQDFLKTLYTRLDIQRSETRIVFNTLKEDFRLIL